MGLVGSVLAGVFRLANGVCFLASLVGTALVCCILLIPVVVTIPIHSIRVIKLRRYYTSAVGKLFFDFAASYLLIFGGTKLFIYSNDHRILDETSSVILMSNHRTRVDWMFVGWCYCYFTNLNMKLKIILKNSLKIVPFFGWAMQCLMFIFLSRSRENDLPHIANSLLYLLTSSYNSNAPCILYFPEGTDLSESNKKKSNEFAESKGLASLNYVLYPKTAGFSIIANTLQRYYASKNLPKELVIHDMTIGYKDFSSRRTSEFSILKGEFPSEIHIRVDRIVLNPDAINNDPVSKRITRRSGSSDNILSRSRSRDGLNEGATNSISYDPRKKYESFLYDLYFTKEKILENFYKFHNNNPNVSDWPPLLVASATSQIRCGRSLLIMYTLLLTLVVAGYMYFLTTVVVIIATSLLFGIFKYFNGLDETEKMLHASMVIEREMSGSASF